MPNKTCYLALLFLIFSNLACAAEPPAQFTPTYSYGVEPDGSVIPHGSGGGGDAPSGHSVPNPLIGRTNALFAGHEPDPIHEWAQSMNQNAEKIASFTRAYEAQNKLAYEMAQNSKKEAPTSTQARSYAKNHKIDLNQITDLDPSKLPFELRSHDPELWKLENDLAKITPEFQFQKNAQEFGLMNVLSADNALMDGDIEDANNFKIIAKELLDIAVGMDPLTGIGRASYELFTGYNMVNGEELSLVDQGVAAATLISLGTVSAAPKLVKMGTLFYKYFKNSEKVEKAARGAEKFLKIGFYKLNQGGLNKKKVFWDERTKTIIDKRAHEIVEFWK